LLDGAIEKVREMGRAFLRQAQVAQAYRRVFETADGGLVLRDILGKCHILETTAVAGDSHMSAHNEGRRAAALDILETLRWTPAHVVALTQEQETGGEAP
jgi:hypothetical protein